MIRFLSAQNRSLVVQVGGDTAIINAMFKYPQNSLLQQRGLGTLCNLCIGSGEWTPNIAVALGYTSSI